ncbi:MAG: lytic transglycosylase domain-containing protein [Bacteroidales bacterium]|nr:lytic transglycosylase domain-containing protein [Bacteroidales bacterium]
MENKKKIWVWCGGMTAGIVVCLCVWGILQHHTQAQEEKAEPARTNYYTNVLATPPLPDSLTFCGENVPLDDPMVRESLDRELTAVCYQHSTTLLCLKRAGRWFPTLEKILKEDGVPEDIKYLCVAESSLSNAISPAKAVGFWQFLESTAKLYGLTVNDEVDERYHVEKCTHAACKYLKTSKNSLGSWALAAASYNMGEGGVRKNVNNQSQNEYWNLYFNPETARYVYRILAYKLLFENPSTYGVRLNESDKYAPYEYEEITVTASVPSWYTFCQEHDMTYKEFKELNPWVRSTKLTVAAGKSYTIKKMTKKKK